MANAGTKKKRASGGPGEESDGSTPSDEDVAHAGDGAQPEDSKLKPETGPQIRDEFWVSTDGPTDGQP